MRGQHICAAHAQKLLTGQIYTKHQSHPQSDQSLERQKLCVHDGTYIFNIIYIRYVILVHKTIAVELMKRSEVKGQTPAQSWALFNCALCQKHCLHTMWSWGQTFSVIMHNYSKFLVLHHHDNMSAYLILLHVHWTCPRYLTAEISAACFRTLN